MIKLIRLFGLFVIISLIYGLGSAFNGDSSIQTEQEIPIKELSTKTVDNSFSESIEDINNNEESKNIDMPLENSQTTISENTEIIYEQKNEVQPQKEKVKEKLTEEKSKQQSTNIVEKESEKSTEIVDSPKKDSENKDNLEIWNELGITEFEYYNSPMWNWQKVTHSTFDECEEAGKDAIKIKINLETGEEYQDYEQFWCYGVNSYSGRFLGVMLKLN